MHIMTACPKLLILHPGLMSIAIPGWLAPIELIYPSSLPLIYLTAPPRFRFPCPSLSEARGAVEAGIRQVESASWGKIPISDAESGRVAHALGFLELGL